MTARALLRPAALGLLVALAATALFDLRALPFSGRERLMAISLVDGQAYFGHVDDVPWSDTILLRDAYYLRDSGGATDLAVSLAKRGIEPHVPADGMRIRRDKVLIIEPVGADSAVARAIAVDRAIARQAAR